ncbi:RecBCD enzyme subunit RecB [Alteromonas sp. 38]|uniref:UvrD-helicase domain-containing protein n=1 Tax=unclassified Alteromonas TaxID=2614992 RepID=UPI0012F2EAB5|nr:MULTISPECIES: UvrD-helicase domain-containing protein [unclassified Alteromonas]CAD5270834.1 RecBCD enzyme subunit RecB [Alteromonas sp. 154]VXB93109.1 RecBCD enzyme subunit RecB [Alteromonas sp. 38]
MSLSTSASQLLNVPAMPLKGRHLIEASAGTGKTYNITRLYLRLLLEKKLNVKEILVMTFTKAATEEIKGRVAKTLREATAFWEACLGVDDTNTGSASAGDDSAGDDGAGRDSASNDKDDLNENADLAALLNSTDPVYAHLYRACSPKDSLALLKAAQLELDDASVFTIHGFCQHVIGQLAFNSGFAMALNLSKDTADLYLQAAQDWIRKVSQNEDDFMLLAEQGWHVPESLLNEFSSSVRSTLTPVLLDEETIEKAFIAGLHENESTAPAQFTFHYNNIVDNEALIHDQLLKKPDHKALRTPELAALKSWLESGEYEPLPPEGAAFLDGRRFGRNKSGVKEILAPIKGFADAISTACKDKQDNLDKIPVFTLVNHAISFIKSNVAAQKQQLGVIDFDDLIRMLADEVVKPNNSLVPELRKKFPVALIDEFQDTDAKQYAILDAVYPKAQVNNSKNHEAGADIKASLGTDVRLDSNQGSGAGFEPDTSKSKSENALLMIGDPKQAIYRFRGGDIFTYLKAGQQADYRWVMNTNWRSVAGMVKAYNRLFYGAPVPPAPISQTQSTQDAIALAPSPRDVFGFNIQYNPVEFTSKAAAATHPLNDSNDERDAMNYVSFSLDEKSDANTLRRGLAQWIAQEIYRLFNEVTFVDEKDPTKPARPVKPADIAILVKNRNEASVIKYVLQQQGLACVYLSDRSNLFASPEAKDVLRLLNGVWHNTDTSKVASSLASPLWGYTPQTLVNLLYHEDDALWDEAYDKVTSLRDMWQQKGCMSVLLHLMQENYTPYGSEVERALTNYQHLAETLEKAGATHQRPEQLLDWLHKQIHQPESDEEMTLRLESDSQLIRLVTQHGSKGLEYPIVFVPFATGYRDPAKSGKSYSQIFTYYDEQSQELQLQLGRTNAAIERVRKEGDAEEMRLAYVAVTRAAHRCYMGVLPLDGHEKSALAHALNINDDEGRDWGTVLDAIASEPQAHATHICADPLAQQYSSFDNTETVVPLSTLTFAGTSSEDWRLYSFSAISRMTVMSAAQGVSFAVPSIPVMQTVRDEEITSNDGFAGTFGEVVTQSMAAGNTEIEETATPLHAAKQGNTKSDTKTAAPHADQIRFTLQKGASAGNLLHDLLELNDFSAPDWSESGAELAVRFGLETARTADLYSWLDEVLATPLSMPTPTSHLLSDSQSQLTLSDLSLPQTLREAEFYFPMNESKWSELKYILFEHRKSVAKQLAVGNNSETATGLPTAEVVPSLMVSALEGMMHGFIDLIFTHDGKYYVADYKSTWLGDSVSHYMPQALNANNQHHLYDLQYLIYCLALHRYLKNAIVDYTPEAHFGGVYYLYLRGMHPSNTNGEGVFFTPIDSVTLEALDRLFLGEETSNEKPSAEKPLADKHSNEEASNDPSPDAVQGELDL